MWTVFHGLSAFLLKGTFVVVGLAVISLAFLYLYGYLLTSPYIRLEEVVISGVDEELKGELLDMAHLNYEHSLLAINLNELQERLEKHAWVRSVSLEKSFFTPSSSMWKRRNPGRSLLQTNSTTWTTGEGCSRKCPPTSGSTSR